MAISRADGLYYSPHYMRRLGLPLRRLRYIISAYNAENNYDYP